MRICGLSILVMLALLSGCVETRNLKKSELDDLYRLTPSLWNQAKPEPISLHGKRIPYRYELRYEPSVIWSVISLHEASQQIDLAEDKIEFDISYRHAKTAARAFGAFARKLKDFSRIIEKKRLQKSERYWAKNTAEIIARTHKLFLAINPDREKRADIEIEDSTAWLIIPLLEMAYSLISRTEIIESFSAKQDNFIEAQKSFYAVVLKSAFSLIGLKSPEALEEKVYAILFDKDKAGRETKFVADLLIKKRRELEFSSEVSGPGHDTAKKAAIASLVFDLMAQLCRQWNKVDSAAFEIRSLGQTGLMALEINIKPGKKLTLKGDHFAAVAVVIRGSNRIIIQPETDPARCTSILFDSAPGGSVSVDFDSFIYLISRIFFIPFDDADFEEVRFVSTTEYPRTKKNTTLVLMRASGKNKTRRLIRIEVIKKPLFEKRKGLPDIYRGDKREVIFQYYNEHRVYSRKSASFKSAFLK